jgi:hypothetical protein
MAGCGAAGQRHSPRSAPARPQQFPAPSLEARVVRLTAEVTPGMPKNAYLKLPTATALWGVPTPSETAAPLSALPTVYEPREAIAHRDGEHAPGDLSLYQPT